LTLNEFQKICKGTSLYGRKLKRIDDLTYSVLALNGEAGELANKLKKHHRAGTEYNVPILADELGDVFWYVADAAGNLGLTLEQVAQMNMDKLAERKKENTVAAVEERR
jgi:NTP pyrophosphatase (non-canonical NTP hydrolase)